MWTEYRAETANVAEGADGTVVEAATADAILQVWMLMIQFMILFFFMSFGFSGS